MKLLYALLIILLTISSNTFAQKVRVDSDPEADFSGVKTYQFLGWQKDSDQILNDLDRERIHSAFKAEFDKRGMELVESGADVAISFFIVVDQKTSTTAYTDYYGGVGYGGYARGGWGWGNGHSTTTYSENDYLQGTLVLDVYSVESEKLVWQAVATKTINENPKNRDKRIQKTAAKMMKKFPVTPVN